MRTVSDTVNYYNKLCDWALPSEFYKEWASVEETVKLMPNTFEWRADILTSVFRMMSNKYIRLKKVDPQGVIHSTLYDWMHNKVVYSFDEDVEATFKDMHWSDIEDQPISVLYHLPVDSFVIHLNRSIDVGNHVYDSVLVWSDYYLKRSDWDNIGLLYFLFTDSTQKDRYQRILPKSMTLVRTDHTINKVQLVDTFREVYEENCKENDELKSSFARGEYKKLMTFIVPYLLYLCSQNAEIVQPKDNERVYRPHTGTPKNKYREVKQLVCGQATGVRIRNFKKQQAERKQSGEGSMKAPHVRRAHYHRFWVGSGDDRHIEIRWLPPIYIHEDLKDYIKPVNPRVKKDYT